jgi:AraC-like DNA-binding protein
MHQPTQEQPDGILNPRLAQQKFEVSRYLPAPDLAFFVHRYWIVEWDLRDQTPFTQEILTYPTFHLVVQRGQSGVFGIMTGKTAHFLQGKAHVFGIKFRPGAFYPFFKAPVSQFTNRPASLVNAFGQAGLDLERAVLTVHDHEEMIALAETFLRGQSLKRDTNIELVNEVVNCIAENRDMTRVDKMARLLGLSKRSLQRLFHQYVGVNPKWVIQRYRLHEAAARLAKEEGVDWTELALQLGYFDQAHFINDFRMIVGQTPMAYRKNVQLITK